MQSISSSIITILALCTSVLHAASTSHDSDLSPKRSAQRLQAGIVSEGRLVGRTWLFPAQALTEPEGSSEKTTTPLIKGRLLLTDTHNTAHPARLAKVMLMGAAGIISETVVAADGAWAISPKSALEGSYALRFSLNNRYWMLRNTDGNDYAWEGPKVTLPIDGDFDTGDWSLDSSLANGQVGYIHLSFLEALDSFARYGIDISWWRQVTTVWPDQDAYYSPSYHAVHLSNPKAWDVNIHELGHSIVATGMRVPSAGGQHKLDECYSANLAGSEGFPTFLAALAHLDLNDPDAKFEYLVPRRAPIKVENVPSDVCQGDNNEWRVTSALGDIVDTNNDDKDVSVISATRLLKALFGQSFAGMKGAWRLLEKQLDAQESAAAKAALRQNTIVYADRPGVARRAAGDTTAWSHPDWDGHQQAITAAVIREDNFVV